MDTLSRLNDVKDTELQSLLSHAIRYALQHNVIAAQVSEQKDNPNSGQAYVIHKDTANLMKAMVEKILDMIPPEPAAKKRATRGKA